MLNLLMVVGKKDTVYPFQQYFPLGACTNMAKNVFKSKVKPIGSTDAKSNYDRLDQIIKDFEGTFDDLEAALGFYLLGRHLGWRPLVVIHNKRTIRKYEQILKINIREEFEDEGPDAERSIGYSVAKRLSNFWKVVSGDESVENRRQAVRGT